MARATLDRAVSDGRLLPIRALKIKNLLDDADRVAVQPLPRPVHLWNQ